MRRFLLLFVALLVCGSLCRRSYMWVDCIHAYGPHYRISIWSASGIVGVQFATGVSLQVHGGLIFRRGLSCNCVRRRISA